MAEKRILVDVKHMNQMAFAETLDILNALDPGRGRHLAGTSTLPPIPDSTMGRSARFADTGGMHG